MDKDRSPAFLPFRTVAWLMLGACLAGLAVGYSAGIDYSSLEGKIEVPAPR